MRLRCRDRSVLSALAGDRGCSGRSSGAAAKPRSARPRRGTREHGSGAHDGQADARGGEALGIETVAVRTDPPPRHARSVARSWCPEGRWYRHRAGGRDVTGGSGAQPGRASPRRPADDDRAAGARPSAISSIEAQRAVDAAEAEERPRASVCSDSSSCSRTARPACAASRKRARSSGRRGGAQRRARAARPRHEGPGRAQGEIVDHRAVRRRRSVGLRGAGSDGRRLRAALQIAQVDTLWVRVPVYAGDVDEIDDVAAARR